MNRIPLELHATCDPISRGDKTPYVVYGLVDPRCGDVFYVGATAAKGNRVRLNSHITTAKRMLRPRKKYINTALANAILSILVDGLRPDIVALGFYATRADAFMAEKVKIDEIGLDNLTNILPGEYIVDKKCGVSSETREKIGKATREWWAKLKRSKQFKYSKDENGFWDCTCKVCGKDFKTKADPRILTCGPACRSEQGRINQRKMWGGKGRKHPL